MLASSNVGVAPQAACDFVNLCYFWGSLVAWGSYPTQKPSAGSKNGKTFDTTTSSYASAASRELGTPTVVTHPPHPLCFNVTGIAIPIFVSRLAHSLPPADYASTLKYGGLGGSMLL